MTKAVSGKDVIIHLAQSQCHSEPDRQVDAVAKVCFEETDILFKSTLLEYAIDAEVGVLKEYIKGSKVAAESFLSSLKSKLTWGQWFKVSWLALTYRFSPFTSSEERLTAVACKIGKFVSAYFSTPPQLDDNSLVEAAKRGNLGVVQILLGYPQKKIQEAFDVAVLNGHKNVIFELSPHVSEEKVLEAAVKEGDIEFLLRKKLSLEQHIAALQKAIEFGQFSSKQVLIDKALCSPERRKQIADFIQKNSIA